MGATASGKTDLLEELFCGEFSEFPEAEIVSADSMQAYRGMDIGTAKPDPQLRARLPHRLIDIRDPNEQYTVGDFVHLADEACRDLALRGKLPVLAGGTGFYVKNFVLGLPSAPAAEAGLRAEIAEELIRRGREALRAELVEKDPEAAARIHPNDDYRLTRALEIQRMTGRRLADFAPSGEPREEYRFLLVELCRPREELYARIEARVEAMFAAGLPAEVAELRRKGFGAAAPGMRAIGYREFFEAEDELGRDAANTLLLGRARELILRDTRRYAKRQETFFRGLPGLHRLEAGPGAATVLAALVRNFLGA